MGTAQSRSTRHRTASERGTALLETALTLPVLLLVAVSIFEFGRAYQTWEVLTNAAREAARVAVLPSYTAGTAEARARDYLQSGQLTNYASATVSVDRAVTIPVGTGTATASRVTVSYPFQFIVLQPVVHLIDKQATLGQPITLTATSLMRNEAQSQ